MLTVPPAESVVVRTADVHAVNEWAYRLVCDSARAEDLTLSPWIDASLDLLPGWYDDWVIFERERLRHRVLHALETLSREFCAVGRFAEGLEAAMLAVSADPVRESAQRVLIEAHLSEGNISEAQRAFSVFRRLILRDLGVPPSPALSGLLTAARIPLPVQADHLRVTSE